MGVSLQDVEARIVKGDAEYVATQEALTTSKVTVVKAREAADKHHAALNEKDEEMKQLQSQLHALVRVLARVPECVCDCQSATVPVPCSHPLRVFV